MSGPGKGKIKIGTADVYIHLKGESGARITHVDVELDELNKIIKDKESSYVGGKPGGVFLGLRKEMIKRADEEAERLRRQQNIELYAAMVEASKPYAAIGGYSRGLREGWLPPLPGAASSRSWASRSFPSPFV